LQTSDILALLERWIWIRVMIWDLQFLYHILKNWYQKNFMRLRFIQLNSLKKIYIVVEKLV